MKLVRDNKFKKGVLAVAVSAALTGCNWFDDDDSSSSSSSSSSTTTTFPVTVDVPASIAPSVASTFDWKNPIKSLFSSAYAQTVADLGAENFEVVIVDGDGNVTEVIPADQIEVEELGNGEYEISVPGRPQLNCLIVLDLDNSLTITNETNINETNALFAPTTSEQGVDIDLESTVAYQQFLEEVQENGGFDAVNEDGTPVYDVDDPGQVAAIEELINNVEQQLESVDLEAIIEDNGLTIEQFLAADDEGTEDTVILDALAAIEAEFEAAVEAVIEEQLEDVQNAVTTTVASIASTGIYWFEAEEGDYIEYGELNVGTPETFYEFDDEGGEWVAETFNEATDTAADDYVLTAEGWVNSADAFEISNVDTEAGAVTISDVVLDIVSGTLTTLQAVDLYSDGERSVEEFVRSRDDEDLADYLSTTTTFSEGAVAVKVGMSPDNENHVLWFDEGDDDGTCWGNQFESPEDYNGNCETVYVRGQQGAATALTDLVTDTETTPDDQAFVGFDIYGDDEEIRVQLIEVDDSVSTEEPASEEQLTSEGEAVAAAIVRTARFFTYEENDAGEYVWVLFEAEDQSIPTWSYTTPEGLGENESIIELPIPEELQELVEDSTMIYGVIDGYVRPGHKEEAGVQNDSDWVYNSIAAEDILEAFIPTSELYNLIAGNTVTATGFDVEEITFGAEGAGSIKFPANEDNEFNEDDVNPISDWTVDPSTNVITFTETSRDETSSDSWDWELTVTNISDDTLTVSVAVEGTEDGSPVSGSGSGTLEIVSYAFTQTELVDGSPHYGTWFNDADEANCSNGWVAEDLSFASDGNYTITLCDETTETGTYSVSESGVLTLNFSEGSDYIQRMGVDSELNADIICWEDSSAALEECTTTTGEYWFDSETARDSFISTENSSSETPSGEEVVFEEEPTSVPQ